MVFAIHWHESAMDLHVVAFPCLCGWGCGAPEASPPSLSGTGSGCGQGSLGWRAGNFRCCRLFLPTWLSVVAEHCPSLTRLPGIVGCGWTVSGSSCPSQKNVSLTEPFWNLFGISSRGKNTERSLTTCEGELSGCSETSTGLTSYPMSWTFSKGISYSSSFYLDVLSGPVLFHLVTRLISQYALQFKEALKRMGFPSGSAVVWSLGLGRSLGGGHGNPLQYSFFFFLSHSSILAWKISRTEETAALQFIGSQRFGHEWSDWARTHARMDVQYF